MPVTGPNMGHEWCRASVAVRECYLNVEEEPECREGEPQQAYLVCR